MPFTVVTESEMLALEATATDDRALFTELTNGMMAALVPDAIERTPDRARQRTFAVHALDREMLLVELLSAVLETIDTYDEVYPDFVITELTATHCVATGTGAPVDALDGSITGILSDRVTITDTPEGRTARVAFDT